jgi:hypothetical protein
MFFYFHTSATSAKLTKRRTSRNTSPRSSITMIQSRLLSSMNWPRNCYTVEIKLLILFCHVVQNIIPGNSKSASARPEPKTPNFSLNLKQETVQSVRTEPIRETRREKFPTLAGSKQPVQETKKVLPPKVNNEISPQERL